MNSARPSDNELPRAGDVVAGKYRIESVIGTGGMGVVLGAQDTSLGRRVAIKFLAPAKADKDGAAARFGREARAAASLQSENVVRIFEVGTLPNGAAFIVMEHLAGGDLAQVLGARGPLPFEEAVDYLLQACEALAEAHGKGIVHRDLKPQNLFLTQLPDGSPCVKVLDFGISKAIDEEAPNLTSTDAVMGTPLYMSPEQVRSLKSVDLRSDIWALGAILFELLTAAPIFEAASITALCAMIAMDPPTSLRAKRPNAPPELEAVIARCMHKDPAGRFPDVAGLADALAPFASERGRVSAARIGRVVRPGAPQAPMMSPPISSSAYATTGTGGNATGSGPYPSQAPPYAPGGMPGAMPAMHTSSQFAQAHPPATQQTWGQQTGAMGPGTIATRRSSGMLFAVLGAVAGLFVLGLVGAGGAYVYSQRGPDDSAKNQADAAVAAAAPPPPAASVAAAAPAPPNPAATAKRGDPRAASSAGKVAGGVAPGSPAAPGATPAPGAAPATTAADDEAAKNARLRQIAQGRCGLQQGELSRNDASNSGARSVKNQACLQASSLSPNSGAANCERANCRTACTILKDQSCLQQLDFAERNNPLKF